MVEYKYYAHDDEARIPDKLFDTFAEAFDYCQDGLVTFISEIPYIDGVEDEDNEEVVWTWDNTFDRDEAIAYVEGRHKVTEAEEEKPEAPAEEVSSEAVEAEDDFWIDFDDIQAKPVEKAEEVISDKNQAIGDFDTEFPEVEVTPKEETCKGCECGQHLINLLKRAAVDFRTLHRNLLEGNWFVIHELIGDYYEEVDHFEDAIVENLISLGCCDKALEGELLEAKPYSEKEALAIIKTRLDEIKEASMECRKEMEIPSAVVPVFDELEQWIEIEADYKIDRYFGHACGEEHKEEAKAEAEAPVDEDLIATKAPEADKEVKLDQKKVSEIHKGKEEHVPGSIVEEMQSDVETALATPGTWGVEFVGNDVTCYDNEAEARAEFDSIKLEDIPADCEGVNLFKVNDDGTSETVEAKTIYDKLEEEYSKVLSDYVRERMAKGEKVNDIVDSEEFKELAVKEGKKDLGLDEEKLAAGLAEAMTDIPDDENK